VFPQLDPFEAKTVENFTSVMVPLIWKDPQPASLVHLVPGEVVAGLMYLPSSDKEMLVGVVPGR
jgi:hypothetical protein